MCDDVDERAVESARPNRKRLAGRRESSPVDLRDVQVFVLGPGESVDVVADDVIDLHALAVLHRRRLKPVVVHAVAVEGPLPRRSDEFH